MNSEKQSDLWEKISPDESLINNALQLAERDIKTAHDVFKQQNSIYTNISSLAEHQ